MKKLTSILLGTSMLVSALFAISPVMVPAYGDGGPVCPAAFRLVEVVDDSNNDIPMAADPTAAGEADDNENNLVCEHIPGCIPGPVGACIKLPDVRIEYLDDNLSAG